MPNAAGVPPLKLDEAGGSPMGKGRAPCRCEPTHQQEFLGQTSEATVHVPKDLVFLEYRADYITLLFSVLT